MSYFKVLQFRRVAVNKPSSGNLERFERITESLFFFDESDADDTRRAEEQAIELAESPPPQRGKFEARISLWGPAPHASKNYGPEGLSIEVKHERCEDQVEGRSRAR